MGIIGLQQGNGYIGGTELGWIILQPHIDYVTAQWVDFHRQHIRIHFN